MKLKKIIAYFLLFNLFLIKSFASGVYYVDSNKYYSKLRDYKKTKAHVVEINCNLLKLENEFLWRLATGFKTELVIHDYEILDPSFSIWYIARYDDIIKNMYKLDKIPNYRIGLFLKNFKKTSFSGKEFDKNSLLKKLINISKFWKSKSETKKDFSVFVCD